MNNVGPRTFAQSQSFEFLPLSVLDNVTCLEALGRFVNTEVLP